MRGSGEETERGREEWSRKKILNSNNKKQRQSWMRVLAAWPESGGAAAPLWRVRGSPHSSALFNGAVHEYCMIPAVGLPGPSRADPSRGIALGLEPAVPVLRGASHVNAHQQSGAGLLQFSQSSVWMETAGVLIIMAQSPEP